MDSKSNYSAEAKKYCNETIYTNAQDMKRFESSKQREAKFNENWKKQTVDLNEIVEKFAPGAIAKQKGGVKLSYKGNEYEVVADMAAGYLRIYHRGIPVKLDGKPGGLDEAHFKIKRRDK